MKKYIPSKNYNPRETIESFVERLKREAKEKQFVTVGFSGKKEVVLFGVSGLITTEFGRFQLVPAKVLFGKWGWHFVLVYPDLESLLKQKKITIRLDSGCYSGMVFGDIICDCGEQLKMAQKLCVRNGCGIIIHMPEHDGRGHKQIKMAEKRLIDELGLSVAEAAKFFHGKDEMIDVRTFNEAATILKALGFQRHAFEMATNNPKKVKAFEIAGVNVVSAKSIHIKNPNNFVKKNLKSKAKFWGHNFKK